MNPLSKQYYQVGGKSPFQEVLFLSDAKDLEWSALSEKVPELPRSWFELARISSKDRIEFVSNRWMDSLSFQPGASRGITRFFLNLDEIDVVVVKSDFLYSVEMVYSLSDNRSFFRGFPPLTEQDIRIFKAEINAHLPTDYFSFFRLHNGFGKLSEMGILPIDEIPKAIQTVREILECQTNAQNYLINPEMLIPFFENLGSFQCFFSDWYPNSEMGNVFLSGIDYTVSDTTSREAWEEECAFATFIEWLSKYLEGINISR